MSQAPEAEGDSRIKVEPGPEPVVGYPEWLESSLNVTAGRDPLGFQTITTDRIIPRLVPAVLALSRRARYLSFHAFLLEDYQRRELTPSNSGLFGVHQAAGVRTVARHPAVPAMGAVRMPVASVGRGRGRGHS